jgi:S1-C subfamily serine protease
MVVRSVENADVPLRQGDVIVAVNSERFESVEAFRKLVEQHAGKTVALLVRRGESALFVPVPVG